MNRTRCMGALPEEEQEGAAYEQLEKWLRQLRKMGLRIDVDEEGNATLGHPKPPGLRMSVPYKDDRDKKGMPEMRRRYDLDRSKQREQCG